MKTLREVLVKCPVPEFLVDKLLEVSVLLYDLHGCSFSTESIYVPFLHIVLMDGGNDMLVNELDSYIAKLKKELREDEIKR